MKVSIITINYNSSEFTIKLVRSILANINSLSDYEIIITDNAIIPLKERVVTEYYDPIAIIGRKLGLR